MKTLLSKLLLFLFLSFCLSACNKIGSPKQKPFTLKIYNPENNSPLTGVPIAIYPFKEPYMEGYEVSYAPGEELFKGTTDQYGELKITEKLKHEKGFFLDCTDDKYQFVGTDYDNTARIFVDKNPKEVWTVQMAETGKLNLDLHHDCTSNESRSSFSLVNTTFSTEVVKVGSVPCGLHTYYYNRLPYGEYKLTILTNKGLNQQVKEETFSVSKGETVNHISTF